MGYTQEQLEVLRKRAREWNHAHKERVKENSKKYAEEHPDRIKAYAKKHRDSHKEEIKAKQLEFKKKFPWYRSWVMAKSRCTNPNAAYYHRYGGRGISFSLSKEECASLWESSKANLMLKPTIDRIDNDGNYVFSNCRFIEYSKNSKKMHKDKKEARRRMLKAERDAKRKGPF